MLRQPLETGEVTISRAHSTVTYPSSFILLLAMNPCPCGYLGSPHHYCTCSQKQIQAYKNRLSGPIYDRMDILLSLQSVNVNKLSHVKESSADIRKRVEAASLKQLDRYGEEVSNNKVPFEKMMAASPLSNEQRQLLTRVSSKQNWSNRVQIKIIRLARTISDLAGEEQLSDGAIWEAMKLRRWDMNKPHLIAREK
ncbi:ATP-binding protein [Bacillus salacetis]|uniref:ATP-binding protein n=1 Tax=Bacillus salacetis TaxID=2315464 RepID=A0A3A1QYY6_9BACI|nr:ATP-binding protein [Bacillus salacetis]